MVWIMYIIETRASPLMRKVYLGMGYSTRVRVVSAADGVRVAEDDRTGRGFSANSILKLSFVTSHISLQLRPPADRSRSVHQTT